MFVRHVRGVGAFPKARRNRLLIIGVHNSHGGAVGADSVMQSLKDILAYRRSLPPTDCWELLDPNSVEETAIRERDIVAKKVRSGHSQHVLREV